MRLHRLIAILLLLESRKKVKAKDLACALETSERTIYRDIEILCQSGVPITSDFGLTGGFQLMDGYTSGLKNMNGDDAVALYLSGIAAGPKAGANLQTTFSKLQQDLPKQYSSDIHKAVSQFYFDPEGWFVQRKPIPFLDVLRQAIWQSQKLRITYRRSSLDREETTQRQIRPYGMVDKNMEWYLVAYCESSCGMRVFRCDRLLDAERLPENYVLPEGFSLEQFWKDWVGEFSGIIAAGQPADTESAELGKNE
jgi:predicted DNA-binding transcriptional regulator YafY